MYNRNLIPYITSIEFNDKIFLGILKIRSKEFITIYNLENMNAEEREEILDLAKTWWWQSNRSIPISVFMSEDVSKFEKFCTRFNTSTVIISGPNISLSELPSKRIKRRNQALKKRKN